MQAETIHEKKLRGGGPQFCERCGAREYLPVGGFFCNVYKVPLGYTCRGVRRDPLCVADHPQGQVSV